MKKFGTKQIVPLALAALSCVFLYMGLTKFGFWNGEPTPAFVPTIVSAIMLVLSLVQFAGSFKEEAAVYYKDEFMIIIAVLLALAGIFVIGMFPALSLFMLIWLGVYEKCPWKSTILVTLCTMGLLYGVFVLWLNVRFPVGIIREMLF